MESKIQLQIKMVIIVLILDYLIILARCTPSRQTPKTSY